jgi:hypothetical protein
MNKEGTGPNPTIGGVHNANPFGRIDNYQCSIVLTSDEIKPMRVSFEFDWTGDRKTSKVVDIKAGSGL